MKLGIVIMNRFMLSLMATAAVAVTSFTSAQAKDWFPATVEVWESAFDINSPRRNIEYQPLEKASKQWDICVSFPHMKDAYWLGVNYGVTAEAKRLGVKMQVVEAGGYTELARQISQIEDCVAAGADAVIIGAISADGLNNTIEEIAAKDIPIIDVSNGISSSDITAKSLVSFVEMGAKAGEYLAQRHPVGSGKVKVAWFPGPSGAGWVEAGNTGFVGAIEDSDIELVETKYGDTGKEVQGRLVEDTLETHPDLQYVVGTAVTAEAAVPILRARGLTDQVKVASYYFTPGIAQGLERRQILAAPTDSTILQARIAVDLAVRALEGEDFERRVSPVLHVVDAENFKDFDQSSTLAPAGFKPVFRVE